MRQFAGLKLVRLPGGIPILKFHHSFEHPGLSKVLFKEMNKHFEKYSLMLREVSIVDAPIISALRSTNNSAGQRDRNMHQTKKGNELHLSMKMHFGIDNMRGPIHIIDTTAANVHDIVPPDKLLHREYQRVFSDAAYLGSRKWD